MINRFKGQAVKNLVGGHYHMKSDGNIVYLSNQTPPTEEELDAEIKRLDAEYNAHEYQRDRAVAYDPIHEQLDQIYHDMDGWKKRIKSVKEKFPKP